MLLTFETPRFVFRCQRGQHLPAKNAGFRWSPQELCWWTGDATRAHVLLNYADPPTKAMLEAAIVQANAAMEASRATDASLDVPCPEGLAYLPYQRGGIAYAMNRPATLIGDEMGLGKTIQAIGVINATPDAKLVLIVCPASLKLNWKRECRKWLTRTFAITIAEGSKPSPAIASMLTAQRDAGRILIVNYDVMDGWSPVLQTVQFDVLIADESHYCKNPKAIRTKALFGGKEKLTKAQLAKNPDREARAFKPIPATRKVFLTGTPIGNRPIELWPLVQALDPAGLGSNWKAYVYRYCAASYDGFGLDVSGASNLDELQQKLRSSIMVRRLKKDVLTDLPAKRRQIIELPADGAAPAAEAESAAAEAAEDRLDALRIRVELAKASENPADYEEAVHALRQAASAAFTEISKLRHAVALAKVPYVVEHLNNTEGKVVVFLHHKDVLERVRAGIAEHGVVVVTGDVAVADRQAAVDAFQNDPAIRFFLGTIGAAGVGLTLTASSHVVMGELDWVPGNVSQAEDRCHRIGQVNSVTVQHLVLEGSLDARMAKVLVAKQEVIDAALDKATDKIEGAAPVTISAEAAAPVESREASTKSAKREQLEAEAITLTAAQIAAIHSGLRVVAGMDSDHAREINGVGFSKIDGGIGHSLAQSIRLTPRQAALGARLVRKYRKQIPAVIVEQVFGEPA